MALSLCPGSWQTSLADYSAPSSQMGTQLQIPQQVLQEAAPNGLGLGETCRPPRLLLIRNWLNLKPLDVALKHLLCASEAATID